ncbi:MAG: periplasmic heavy metal sensor [Candidatus Azotimanducaceae bacterium WSBS_2022_MAG_OTU7]
MNKKAVLVTTLLVLSIGLSLVFVGVVVGRHLFDIPTGRDHFKWMTQEVSEETRRKLRSNRVKYMQESRPVRRELEKAQEQLRTAITTDEYVEADVVARLADVRRASFKLRESMHEQMVENFRHLEPEERSRVLGMLMRQDKGRLGLTSQHSRRPGGPPQD